MGCKKSKQLFLILTDDNDLAFFRRLWPCFFPNGNFMKKMRFYVLLLAVLCGWPNVHAGEIALTFDDAPMPDSALMTGAQRTQKLIAALQASAVKDVLFFCTTKHIDKKGDQRLQQYVANGFHLAHHSHSHESANILTHEAYLQDFVKADGILRKYKNFLPLHRFPFLHYGKDVASIQALQKSIHQAGYEMGYVTVDNADWYLNHLMLKAFEEGNPQAVDVMRELYVNTLWNGIVFFDNLAKKTLGRSPKHVLLLHENDTSALFIADLVVKIRSEGWKIISPQEAYLDPLANKLPGGSFHKQGRIAALAHETGTPVDELKSSFEKPEQLDIQFQSLMQQAAIKQKP